MDESSGVGGEALDEAGGAGSRGLSGFGGKVEDPVVDDVAPGHDQQGSGDSVDVTDDAADASDEGVLGDGDGDDERSGRRSQQQFVDAVGESAGADLAALEVHDVAVGVDEHGGGHGERLERFE